MDSNTFLIDQQCLVKGGEGESPDPRMILAAVESSEGFAENKVAMQKSRESSNWRERDPISTR